jgi:hypothetical protein
MKFMMFIKHPADYDIKDVPQAMFAAMGEFVEENAKKGVFLDGAGLQPLSKATRVKVSGGKIKVSDGPFAEAKEVVGGYALCETSTYEEAVALATKFMDLHRIHWPGFEGEAEVRPLEEQQG